MSPAGRKSHIVHRGKTNYWSVSGGGAATRGAGLSEMVGAR